MEKNFAKGDCMKKVILCVFMSILFVQCRTNKKSKENVTPQDKKDIAEEIQDIAEEHQNSKDCTGANTNSICDVTEEIAENPEVIEEVVEELIKDPDATDTSAIEEILELEEAVTGDPSARKKNWALLGPGIGLLAVGSFALAAGTAGAGVSAYKAWDKGRAEALEDVDEGAKKLQKLFDEINLSSSEIKFEPETLKIFLWTYTKNGELNTKRIREDLVNREIDPQSRTTLYYFSEAIAKTQGGVSPISVEEMINADSQLREKKGQLDAINKQLDQKFQASSTSKTTEAKPLRDAGLDQDDLNKILSTNKAEVPTRMFTGKKALLGGLLVGGAAIAAGGAVLTQQGLGLTEGSSQSATERALIKFGSAFRRIQSAARSNM